MMNIRLERPDKTHIEEILRYKEEFISNGDSKKRRYWINIG